jgi:hypothetical protein
MPIDVDTSEAPAFIRITLRGAWPSIEEQRDARERAIAAGVLTPQTRALIDFRDLSSTASHTEVETIIAAAMKAGGLPLHRAYVVGSAVQFGLVRQLKALAPTDLVDLEIFTNEEDALLWLWRNERKD